MVIATSTNEQTKSKRLSFIDKSKSWAKQLIKKSPQIDCIATNTDTNLFTYKRVSSLSTLSPLDENGYLIPIQIIEEIIKNEYSQSQSSLKQQQPQNYVILSSDSSTNKTANSCIRAKQTPVVHVHVPQRRFSLNTNINSNNNNNKFDDIKRNLIDYNLIPKKFNYKDLKFCDQVDEPLIYIDSQENNLDCNASMTASVTPRASTMNQQEAQFMKRKNILNLMDTDLLEETLSTSNTSLSNTTATSSSSESFDFSSPVSSTRSSSNVSESVLSDMMKLSRCLMYEKSWENSSALHLINNLVPPQVPAPGLPSNDDDTKHLLAYNSPQKNTDSLETVSKTNDSESINEEQEDLNEPWYQPNLTRDDVYNILTMLDIGSFLIRLSNSCKNCYALSIRVPYFANPSGIAHYLITRNIKSGFKLKGVDKEFKSLKSLITHYSVMQEILPVTLNLCSFSMFTKKTRNALRN